MRFPDEFADLLTPKGRRILSGREAASTSMEMPQRFIPIAGAIDRKRAKACRDLLDHHLLAALSPLSAPIPPETITAMQKNYDEWLPKTSRVYTAYLEKRRTRAFAICEEMGLVTMLRSQSFGAFASVIAGRALKSRWGMQVLCYRPGDYAGPHNDHHPEEPAAVDGYLDVHITLATPEVDHQWLVSAKRGHFSEIHDINTLGGITAYRLPFWHYTTPLTARAGHTDEARRWVLLGTFLYRQTMEKKSLNK